MPARPRTVSSIRPPSSRPSVFTGETPTAPGGTVQAQASYAYGGVGNRTSLTSGGSTTTYSYNALDQLTSTSSPSQSASYTYDGRGNLYTYGYDTNGTLSSVSFPGVSTPASYTYDSTHLLLSAKDPRGNNARGCTTERPV